ncbi:MAG: NAD-dependent epimerase/dehydratase family protein [Alphaproteobacteria bacterium]|nr:NAD-dependent epimerase/dehydratase family protein [Alphaproteobacteria bacterium]
MMPSGEIAALYEDKRVLVTGAGGFVGGSIVACLAEAGCRVRRHSRKPLPPLGNPRVDDVAGEVREQGLWDRVLDGVDVVFHCAAQTSVYQADSDPLGDLAANVAFPLRLLEAARRSPGMVTVVLASTATVVGLADSLPVEHSRRPMPVTAYDVGKLAAEQYLSLYVRLGHVRGGALRLANVFGPGPGSSAADRGVLNKVLQRALDGGPVSLFGDGRWVRDYVFIDDVVAAFLRAGGTGDALGGEAYHVCTGQGTTVADAFRMAAEVAALRTGHDVEIVGVPLPEGLSAIEFRDFVGSWDALHRAVGWRPSVSLRDGLERTAAAFLSRPPHP